MRRVKSLVFLAVLAMMVFGLVATADAAFSDVGKYGTPVNSLNALGIVNGYPDGTIKPDQPITRAEFAKVAVMELGLNADVAPAGTMFSDVTSAHWAGGLINLAVGQGLMKGYPDGTFKPDAQITYAEVVTVLVRMLGYGPSMDESTWPASYLAKAAQVGVTDGVKVSQNAPATRGDVFLMAFNSLDADVMLQTGWGTDIVYEESDDFDDTILGSKLNIVRIGDDDDPVTVDDVPLTNKSFESDTLSVVVDEAGPYKNDDGDYELVDTLNPNDYLGLEVELWKDDSTDKVVWVRVQTDDSDIINDVVDDFGTETIGGQDVVKSFTMLKSGKKYNIADDVIAYMNTNVVSETVDGDEYILVNKNRGVDVGTVPDFFGRAVKIVLDDNGDVAFIESFKGNTWIASEDADVEDEEIRGYPDSDSEYTIDLSDTDRYIVLKDGKKATLADIKKDDLFVVYPNPLPVVDDADEEDIRLIKVFSGKVTGTLEDVYSEGGHVNDYYLTIDGKNYAMAGDVYESDYGIAAWNTFSTDNNDSIEALEEDDIDDLLGEEVTLYLAGTAVRHIVTSTDVSGSDDIYAILTTADYSTFEDLRFKVTNKNGDEVTYDATDDTEYYIDELGAASEAQLQAYFNGLTAPATWTNGSDIGDEDKWNNGTWDTQTGVDAQYLVKIDLDSSGDLDELRFLAKVRGTAVDTVNTIDIDENDNRLKVGSKSYPVEEWASLFDLTSVGTGVDDVSWSTLQDTMDKSSIDLTGYAYVDDGDVVAFAMTVPGDAPSVSSDVLAGVVMSRSKISDGYKFTIMVNGESKVYNSDGENVARNSFAGDNEGTRNTSGKTTDIIKGDAVVFELNGSDEISEIYELVIGGDDWDTTVGGAVYDDPGQRWLVVDKDDDAAILTLAPMNDDGKEVVEANGTKYRFTVDLSTSDDADEKTYIYDYTDSTPELVEMGNISTGDEVMIFYFRDNNLTKAAENLDRSGGDADESMIQIVKIVD